MNTTAPRANSAQHPQARTLNNQFLFNCFFHRQLIARDIAGALAVRFKRRYPSVIVKCSVIGGIA
ncbi:MAG: hypothetical protein QX197_07165 [Methylococcaceae bacterium]